MKYKSLFIVNRNDYDIRNYESTLSNVGTEKFVVFTDNSIDKNKKRKEKQQQLSIDPC